MHSKCRYVIICHMLCNFTKIASFSVPKCPPKLLAIAFSYVLEENRPNRLFLILFIKKSTHP